MLRAASRERIGVINSQGTRSQLHLGPHLTMAIVDLTRPVHESKESRYICSFPRANIHPISCTGYGIISPAEDQSSHDLHSQFATNVHGTLHILQTTIPYFRTQRIPGRYLIFSSTAGALGVPGLAPYCATKYAVEGLVESMLYEVHAFNIKATLVEPGFVRDDYPTASTNSSTRAAAMFEPELQSSHPTQTHRELLAGMHHQPKYAHFLVHPHPSPPYTHPTSPSMHSKRIFQWLDGRQPTSAVRCAELVWQLAHCRYPPLRLLLGTYAVDSVRDRLRCVTEEIEDWKFLSFGEGPGGGGADGGRSGGDEMEGVRSGENEEDFPTQVGVQQP